MSAYSDRVQEHFYNPKNVGVLADANAVGLAGAMSSGDALKLMLKIDGDVITEAKFQTFGGSCTIASSSAVTEMVIGKTTDEALRITAADIAEFLGGLPAEKMYCSVLGYEALQSAIAKYRAQPGEDDSVQAALLCKCSNVSGDMLERTVRMSKLTTPDAVTAYTKAGSRCISCFKQIEALLAHVNAEMAEEGLIARTEAYRIGSATPRLIDTLPRGEGAAAPITVRPHLAPAPKPTAAPPPRRAPIAAAKREPSEKITLIADAIEDLRPRLRQDGGDCELIDVDGNTVFVKLSGNCVGCQLASVTLSGVQAKLADKLNLPLRVVPVQ